MSELLIGWTTCDSAEAARQLANELIARDLAACVQIDDSVHSLYKFEGEVRSDREWRIWVKFTSQQLEAVSAFIDQNHPYEIPQWIVVKAESVAQKYLIWALGSAE